MNQSSPPMPSEPMSDSPKMRDTPLEKLGQVQLISLLAEAIETNNAPSYNVKGILRELFDRVDWQKAARDE